MRARLCDPKAGKLSAKVRLYKSRSTRYYLEADEFRLGIKRSEILMRKFLHKFVMRPKKPRVNFDASFLARDGIPPLQRGVKIVCDMLSVVSNTINFV